MLVIALSRATESSPFSGDPDSRGRVTLQRKGRGNHSFMSECTRSILMLTDDVYQLDRRIVQEGLSLFKRWGKPKTTITIAGVSDQLKKPADLPESIIWHQAEGAEDPMIARRHFKQQVWKLAEKAGLPHLEEWFRYNFRDPARRVAGAIADGFSPEAFSLIVAHSLTVLPAALELRARSNQPCRVLYDAHELFEEQLDVFHTHKASGYWASVAKEFIPQADAVLTVSHGIAEHMKGSYGLKDAPTVVHNACPHTANTPPSNALAELYGIDPALKIILCQGGLLQGRGLEILIDSARHLPKSEVALVFLGTGPAEYMKNLKKRISPKGAGVFLGKSVPQDQLHHHTLSADLGVITNRGPGLNNTDGAPNRLFEYIQARLPILAHTHRGIAQILDQTDTGWVIEWKNPAQLAELLLDKLESGRHIPAKALDKAAKTFSWEAEEERFLPVVNSLFETSI